MLGDFFYVQFGTSLLHIMRSYGCDLERPFCTSGNLRFGTPLLHRGGVLSFVRDVRSVTGGVRNGEGAIATMDAMALISSYARRALAHAAAFAKEAALETLWPTRCAICDAPGHLICPACLRALRYVDANRACPVCGAPFGQHQCTECNDAMLKAASRDALPVDGMAHVLLADGAARRIVTTYKDANEQRLAADIARLMARCVPPEWRQAHVVHIPATKDAVRRRGFDHADALADELATAARMQRARLFARPKNADQRAFDRRGRMQNMSGRFHLETERIPKEVLLVDDICTTGATLFAAADCLRASGAQAVYALTFAKVLAS